MRRPREELEPCDYREVLPTLLDLVGREVELAIIPERHCARQIVAARGRLEAGPELGNDEDALMPVSIGSVSLALKRSWIENSWRGSARATLVLLFRGGVLVDIEPITDV